MSKPYYSKEILVKALSRMSEIAEAENIQLQLCVFGGAAMMLAYDARDVTKDVDAILLPREAGQRIASMVAAELNLSDDWLNDEVGMFLSHSDEAKTIEFTLPDVSRSGLKITRPTAKYLLALKVNACRKQIGSYKGDEDDIKVLLRITKVGSVEEIEDVVNRFFPDTVIPVEDRLLLNAILKEINHVEHHQTQAGDRKRGRFRLK